jgi:acyl phosphate:glycerol-3-phosphate acyltransferase
MLAELFSWLFVGPHGLLAIGFGYLLGSIPFGLVLTRMAGTQDIRTIGSGNIGATNVLRTGNKGLAVATLLGDALKGTVAVLIAGIWGPGLALIAGFGAFLGHLFPVWLGFKGGKGVATFLGILFGLWWKGGLLFAGIWLVIAYLFRYSSVAALIACTAVPIALYVSGHVAMAGLFTVLTILIFIMHRPNIQKLVSGTESKIGQKA